MSVKIAVIGAGSFVFGPSVLNDAIVEHRLEGSEIALIDLNREVVDLMAAIGRRMATESGVNVSITAHTDRKTALGGADFVICSAARDMHRRFEMDCEIIRRLAPGHLVTEFGGIQGISYSLRQIAMMEEIVADMKQLSPKAWLCNTANPLPRVAQATHEMGIKTAGFCSNSMGGYAFIGHVMDQQSVDYPWSAARAKYEAIMGGVNHFTWMLQLRDRISGADRTDEFRRRAAEVGEFKNSRTGELFQQTGYWPTAGDAHMFDFLTPDRFSKPLQETSHGSPEERERRMNLLRDIASGKQDWRPLIKHRAWEKPVDLVAAMALGRKAEFHSLNLVNTQGQIEELPRQIFVETPATADSDGPVPVKIKLPKPVLDYCKPTAETTDTIVRAAMKRSRTLVHRAIELDPTILDKKAGISAMDECLRAHSDILPKFE